MNTHSHPTSIQTAPIAGNLLRFPTVAETGTNQAWTVEADHRAAGLPIALVCAAGAARATLETIHFHRFVEIFDTAQTARRWLSVDSDASEARRAA